MAVRQNDSEQQLELGNNVSVTYLFNIFLESIMFDVLEEQDGQAIIGCQSVNDIDALAEEEHELEGLTDSATNLAQDIK